MLGYVRCEEGEMLVKHQRLYRAVYCGLCHSVRKLGARALLPFYSYDFVFLALVRMLVCGEKMKLERDRCLLHPFQKKKQRMAHNPTLAYTAFGALVLTAEKMQDDLLDRDSPFFRRLPIRIFFPILRREEKRIEKEHPEYQGLSKDLSGLLSKGRELEQQNASLDAMSENFANCMSLLFSFGTEGREKRILAALGDQLGRVLYTLDALDDREKDLETGAFNPILANGKLPDEDVLSRIDMVLSFYVAEMKKILDLVEGDRALFAICEHIICLGLPGAARTILKPKNGETNERSLSGSRGKP